MSDEKIFYEILQSREDRALKQVEIIATYNNPIISFTLNIPGPIKDSVKYRNIHNLGMEIISDSLKGSNKKVVYMEKINKSTGPEGYFSIDIDSIELKKIAVKIEDKHELGRLFDIDVFDTNYKQISRVDLGMDLRTCLICQNKAKICNRAGSHTVEQLIKKIESMYKIYLENKLK